jgi:sterol desaturase/sphingolipid hydroxylase (fatty acid hydroxylase superfamily)
MKKYAHIELVYSIIILIGVTLLIVLGINSIIGINEEIYVISGLWTLNGLIISVVVSFILAFALIDLEYFVIKHYISKIKLSLNITN